MQNAVLVKCPATSANLGSGFDICGIALAEPFDFLNARIAKSPSSANSVKNSPKGKYLVPENFEENTCGPVAQKMLEDFGIKESVEITIEKNIKPASGLGSSAATAAGTAFALNELFSLKLSKEKLVEYASLGETVSAGNPHFDNVTPAIFGGFTATHRASPLSLSRFSPPKNLELLAVRPFKEKGSTKIARSVLPETIPRADANRNLSHLAQLVCGFAQGDCQKIISGLDDCIAEPARAKAGILFGLPEFKAIAKNFGFGACASGAGPSLIAFCEKENPNKRVFEREAKEIFARQGLQCEAWWTKISETGVQLVQ